LPQPELAALGPPLLASGWGGPASGALLVPALPAMPELPLAAAVPAVPAAPVVPPDPPRPAALAPPAASGVPPAPAETEPAGSAPSLHEAAKIHAVAEASQSAEETRRIP